jgi:hypothetical protein
MGGGLSKAYSLPENMLQLPPGDMKVNPILLVTHFIFKSIQNNFSGTVTVHNAQ